jgi:hypothetical protein
MAEQRYRRQLEPALGGKYKKSGIRMNLPGIHDTHGMT